MMDTEGTLTEQRAGLQITASVGGQSIVLTIDSFGRGDDNTDGPNISASDLVEESVNVRASVPEAGSLGGFGSSSIFGNDGATSGAGSYACERDALTITVTGFDPVVFDRVDRILEPSSTIPA